MEFLRAIGPVFNFLLLAGALFFLTRKRIRKLFRDRKERIAEAIMSFGLACFMAGVAYGKDHGNKKKK